MKQLIRVAGFIILLDQISKWLAGKFWPSWVQLNSGGALSLVGKPEILNYGWLIWVGLVLVGWMSWLIWQSQQFPKSRLVSESAVPLGLIWGGGMSNWLDRWLMSGVRDWLVIPGTPLKNNLADWAITLGVVWWLWQSARVKPPKPVKLSTS
ncbi:MAG TPA: hypothetical protein DEP87_04195 [Candidatus Pacebacteria bacterium]|nr:hypothetical protein [Candidatus Paceibacterota bacterium]